MKTWPTYCLMLVLSLVLSVFMTQGAFAQTEEEIEQAVESIEEFAEHLGENVEEIGESLEKWLEEHSQEIENWADEYSEQWEAWAEEFENRFNSWAEEQERVWEDWAEEYSKRWEGWAEEIESESLDADELNDLVKRNLKMLGDMPLGQMIDGLLKEGTEGFETAPWESLQDLQSMLQNSIEKSVDDAERKLHQKQKAIARMTAGGGDEVVEFETDFILPVIENQQDGLKAKQKILAEEARVVLEKLQRKLAEGDLDSDELRDLLQQLVRDTENKGKQKAESKKRTAKENRELAQRRREQAVRDRVTKAKRSDSTAAEEYQLAAEKRLVDALNRVRDGEDSAKSSRDALQKMYKALEAEEHKIQRKNNELEELRQEIKQLRKEVEKMRKDRQDK